MAGVLFKLDKSGHGEVAKWGEDAESRAAGDAAFKALADKGFTMFDTSDKLVGKPAMHAFDPEATEIVAVPRLVAG
jgi:hypothetical protein